MTEPTRSGRSIERESALANVPSSKAFGSRRRKVQLTFSLRKDQSILLLLLRLSRNRLDLTPIDQIRVFNRLAPHQNKSLQVQEMQRLDLNIVTLGIGFEELG